MKCLVTGGSGFIGKYLIEKLSNDNVKIFNFDKVKTPYSYN